MILKKMLRKGTQSRTKNKKMWESFPQEGWDSIPTQKHLFPGNNSHTNKSQIRIQRQQIRIKRQWIPKQQQWTHIQRKRIWIQRQWNKIQWQWIQRSGSNKYRPTNNGSGSRSVNQMIFVFIFKFGPENTIRSLEGPHHWSKLWISHSCNVFTIYRVREEKRHFPPNYNFAQVPQKWGYFAFFCKVRRISHK